MAHVNFGVGGCRIIERVVGLHPKVSWRSELRNLSNVVASVRFSNVPIEDPNADYICMGVQPSAHATDMGIHPYHFIKGNDGCFQLVTAEREFDVDAQEFGPHWWAIAPVEEDEAYRQIQTREMDARRFGLL
jgi:hypothetical protein